MSDEEHPELDFDPLDDTKVWPEERVPAAPVGRMVLNRIPENFFAESEQIAFGTGVLVDGLDFSEDKMLQGRTFSYSDTQRYRVGPNYLQLPVNQPRHATCRPTSATAQMTYHVDSGGENPHVNYEPSTHGRPARGPRGPTHPSRGPESTAGTRKRISRTNDYQQAGERYLLSEPWERDDLVTNLVSLLGSATGRSRSGWSGTCSCARTSSASAWARGSASASTTSSTSQPLATQTLSEAELERAAQPRPQRAARRRGQGHDPLRAQRAGGDRRRGDGLRLRLVPRRSGRWTQLGATDELARLDEAGRQPV